MTRTRIVLAAGALGAGAVALARRRAAARRVDSPAAEPPAVAPPPPAGRPRTVRSDDDVALSVVEHGTQEAPTATVVLAHGDVQSSALWAGQVHDLVDARPDLRVVTERSARSTHACSSGGVPIPHSSARPSRCTRRARARPSPPPGRRSPSTTARRRCRCWRTCRRSSSSATATCCARCRTAARSAALPGSELVVYPGVGHTVHLERRAEVSRHLVELVDRAVGRPAG